MTLIKRSMFLFTLLLVLATALATSVAAAPSTVTDSANSAAAGYFSDVPTTHANYVAIEKVRKAGVMFGYATTPPTFGPTDKLTREQGASVVARLLGLSPSNGTSCFTDLTVGSPHNGDICALKAKGVVKGYGNGRFGPNDSLEQAQIVALVARGMVETGQWKAKADNGKVYPTFQDPLRADIVNYVMNAGPVFGSTNTAGPLNEAHSSANRAFTAQVVAIVLP